MSTGGPDLFVICKSCGAEVSPYITECPYCGNRLRKRAPKLDREGRVAERRRPPAPGAAAPAPRRDPRDPGRGPPVRDARCWSRSGWSAPILWRTTLGPPTHLIVLGKPGGEWWRVLTAPFIYDNTGYAFAVDRDDRPVRLAARAPPRPVGGAGAVRASAGSAARRSPPPRRAVPVVLGANGAALALLVAWAIPDLLELRAGREIEGDLIGAAVIAVVVALMPLDPHRGELDLRRRRRRSAGLVVGLPLARAAPAR